MNTGWDSGEYASGFGKAASFYPAKVETIDRHPDKRPSDSAWEITTLPVGYVETLVVRGLGVLHFSMGSVPDTGRLDPIGLLTFSSDVLLFGLDAEEGAPT